MPEYIFENVDTGEVEELILPMSEAPSFGCVIERDGKKLRRILQAEHVVVADRQSRRTWPQVNHSLPRNLPRDVAPIQDSHGRPVITSMKHAREVAARTGFTIE